VSVYDQLHSTTGRKTQGRPLTIGAFARRSRLSPKALRLYDRHGILVPAHVDQENGYRRYHESQLGAARLIAMLRRIDMPLAQGAEVIAAFDHQGAEVTTMRRSDKPLPEAAALVASYWREVERRVASQRELAAYIQLKLLGKEGSYEMYQIQERDMPEQIVLTEQRHVLVDELPSWIGAAGMRLMKSAEGHGGVTGPMLVIYHGEVNQDSDGPVEVCIPIRNVNESANDAAVRREPAHREAYTRITKAQVAFPQIVSAYEAVDQWIRSNGKQLSASPREVYFADWDASGPNDEVCDIAFPIE
jgi:DNA-binding transcriptional MerR regulator/effector-binding domain-containing protein